LEQERSIAKQRGWSCYSDKKEFREDFNQSGPKQATNIEVGRQSGADQSREDGFWKSQLAHCSVETYNTIIAARDFTGCGSWLPIDAGICGMVDRLADKVDRIKTCGDGQVPLQAAVAWLLLNDGEFNSSEKEVLYDQNRSVNVGL